MILALTQIQTRERFAEIDIFAFIVIVSGKTGSALFAVVSADGVGTFFIGIAFKAAVLTFIDVFTWCSRSITTMAIWT